MNKKKIIILSIVALFFVLITFAVVYNYDLIIAVKDGIFETKENLDIKKEENAKKEQEALKEAGVENVRPLTEEEKKEFTEGNITEEEVINIITGKTTVEEVKQNKNDSKEQVSNPKPPAKDNKENETNEKIAELVGQIYVIEAKFTSELTALERWALSQFEHLPTVEEKKAKKKELMAYGFPKLSALEKECDTQVSKVLKELESVLKSAGQSTELCRQIEDAYYEKKQITKSYYINEYM
jgi:hypothetical protein